MALAGELTKYIGGELAKNTGKELATKAVTSTLSSIVPKLATKAGTNVASKIGNEFIAGSILNNLAPTTRMLDKAGKPVTFYHSTPNEFDKFDDAMLGSNTGYDNTALGHFVTPDKDFSKRFIDIDNLGKTGRTMELQGNIQKPITHPYMAGYKYDNKDLDKIVEDYLLATDNPEFLDELRGYALDDNSNLYDEYMGLTMADSPFEVAGSDRQSLMNKGYDAVEIVEGPKSGLVEGAKSNSPVSSYAVFNGENLRPVRHLPINQVSNTEEVPVSTLRTLFRGQKKGSDDLYYNKGDGTTGSLTVGNGYYMTPNAEKANIWAGEGITPIRVQANTKDILSRNELVEKTNWANDLINDNDYMAKLWGENPEMADFIENLSAGRLPEVSKYLDKPFIQPDSGQGEELAETIFFPDTRPELTEEIRASLKGNSPKIQYSLPEEPGKTIYHGTPNKFEDFDESLPSIWFSDSDKSLRDTGLSIKGGQPMNIMKRELPKNLNIADEDLADRLTKSQLQARGYDGVAYTERGPNGDETYYEIFNPNKTLKKIPDIQKSGVELSPQQQEFFKDSVVRDENGELMPMYHGTRGDFTIFGEKNPSSSSNSKSGVGFWFTPTEEGAKNFASSIWYGDGEPKAMKTYLNIKNPKVYESVDNSKAVEVLRKELEKIELKSKTMSKPKLYYKNMYDYSVAYNMVNQGDKDMAIKWLADKSSYDDKTATELIEEIDNMKMLEDEKKRIQDEISELKYGDAYERFRTDIYKVDGQTAEDANVGGIGMALRDDSSVQKYVDNLKAEGYDGIIIKGTNYDSDTMGGMNDQYVAFYPEQIKNVDNLNPTNNPDIRYATGLSRGSSGFDDSIERIGSEGIPATRKDTLPEGWDTLEKYLGGVDKRVENVIGKAKSKITKSDLVQFLEENDYDSEGTFNELWQRVKDAVDDMTMEELNFAGGGSAADIIQMRQRPDMNNIEDVYMGNKGHTGRLDAEYSDRLGISKSTTPMSDKLSQPLEYAQGDYGAGVIGLDTTWSSGEAGVSNVAHERMHAWQDKSRGFDYSDEFKKAFEELEDEIIPLLHNKDEISKYWNGRNTDYYFDRNEQEARMVQDYLEYKNHTKRYMGGKRKYEYDERIIKPFDKFYAKLRELSKKGIAIPALAGVFGLGALANKKDDEKLDNVK